MTGFEKLKVEDVAEVLGTTKETIRKGLRQRQFEWGYAIQTSPGRWVYIINGKRFREIEGVDLNG